MNCLIQKYVNDFLEGLKSGEIRPDKLADMTSKERRAFLEKYVGKENSKWVNADFESKLLLKNVEAGILSWAKKTAGLNKKTNNDFASKVQKLDKAYDPNNPDAYLRDIVERRLGIQVEASEFKRLIDLTSELSSINKASNRQDYANKLVEINNYVREIRKDYVPSSLADMARHYSLEGLALGRTVMTSMFDVSATMRQARALFLTKQWNEAFMRLPGYLKSQTGINQLEASIYMDKNADLLLKYKNDLGLTLLGDSFTLREESFASSLSNKIPGVAMSNRAYVGFLNDVRFHRFSDIITQYHKSGRELTPKELKDLAQVISAATGRGQVPNGVGSSLSTVMFSPRFFASRIQTLLNPALKSGPARVEAAKDLARLVGTSVGMLALLKMAGADVETDSRSSDYGKVKEGNGRYDVTGGMAPYIVFMSRFAQQSTKSSTTGKISKLGTDYGEMSAKDLFYNFIESKASPVAGLARDILEGKTMSGEKIGFGADVGQNAKEISKALFVPLLAKDAIDAFNEGAGGSDVVAALASVVAGGVGLGVASYQVTPSGEKWDRFEKENKAKYTIALDEYRNKINDGLDKLNNSDSFNKLPDTGKNSKATKIDKLKADVNKNILMKYGHYNKI